MFLLDIFLFLLLDKKCSDPTFLVIDFNSFL